MPEPPRPVEPLELPVPDAPPLVLGEALEPDEDAPLLVLGEVLEPAEEEPLVA